MGDRNNKLNRLIKTFLTNARGKYTMSNPDIELKISDNLLKPLTKFEVVDSQDKNMIQPYSVGFVVQPSINGNSLVANGVFPYKVVFLRKGKNGKPRLDRGDMIIQMFDFFNNERVTASHKFKIQCKELEISNKLLITMDDADFLGWITAMALFLENVTKNSELPESVFTTLDEIRNLPGRFYDDPEGIRNRYRNIEYRLSIIHTLRLVETRSMRSISKYYSRVYNYMIKFIEKLSHDYNEKTLVDMFHVNKELLQLTIEKLTSDMNKLIGSNGVGITNTETLNADIITGTLNTDVLLNTTSSGAVVDSVSWFGENLYDTDTDLYDTSTTVYESPTIIETDILEVETGAPDQPDQMVNQINLEQPENGFLVQNQTPEGNKPHHPRGFGKIPTASQNLDREDVFHKQAFIKAQMIAKNKKVNNGNDRNINNKEIQWCNKEIRWGNISAGSYITLKHNTEPEEAKHNMEPEEAQRIKTTYYTPNISTMSNNTENIEIETETTNIEIENDAENTTLPINTITGSVVDDITVLGTLKEKKLNNENQ